VAVGPIPVTIDANCGLNIHLAGGSHVPIGEPRVAIAGNFNMGAFAYAEASLRVPGFSVGVEARGELGVSQLGVLN